MTKFALVITNIFGLLTMGLMAYGVWFVYKQETFETAEITFLMFVCFIMTVLFGSGIKRGE